MANAITTHNLIFWGFLLLMGFCLPSQAQKRHLRFNHFSPEVEHAQSSINDLTQDSQGFLWIATDHSLSRFDGYHFKNFKHRVGDEKSISSNHIRRLLIDHSGSLWVATAEGVLNRFNRSQEWFDRFLLPHEQANSPVITSLIKGREAMIWIGTQSLGLYRFNAIKKKFKRYATNAPDAAFPELNINALTLDQKGILWVGSQSGLYFYDKQRDTFIAHTENPQVGSVLSLLEDNSGRLWLGTANGLYVLDMARQSLQPVAALVRPIHVSCLEVDHKGRLWLGSRQGVFLLDGQSLEVQHYQQNPIDPESLSDNRVRTLFLDESRTLWVGGPKGLNFLDLGTNGFPHYALENGNANSLSHNNIEALLEDQQGTLWVATATGLDRFDRSVGAVTHRFYQDGEGGLMSAPITCMIQSKDGFLWLGSSDGLSSFHPKHPANIRHLVPSKEPQSLSSPQCNALLEDSKNRLWVGTSAGLNLMTHREPGRFKRFLNDPKRADSLSAEAISCLLDAPQDGLWVGTSGGLDLLDNQQIGFRHFRHDPNNTVSLSNNEVTQLLYDQDQRLWVGTSGGLNILTSPAQAQFRHLYEADGLPSEVIKGLLLDRRGVVWASTSRGLASIVPKTLKVRAYSIKDGLQSNLFNQGACYRSPSTGELFFGGTSGFNAYYPGQISPNPVAPQIAFTQLRINNECVQLKRLDPESPLQLPINLAKSIRLTHHQNAFSLEFAALHFGQPQANAYAYKLVGFNDSWHYVSADRRLASFTNLDEKVYTLRIKAANKDGIWNHVGHQLVIDIIAPPWRSWWAYTGYLLLLLGILVAFVHYHRLKLKRERESNERLCQIDRLKDGFLAHTSHELRTPLNGIIGIAESLVVGSAGEVSRKMAYNLGMIISSGKRLTNLVNDILDLSSLKGRDLKLQIKPVDIYGLTETILSLSQPLLGNKTLRLINGIEPKTPLASGDEARLQQIMHNLVGNGVKFTESGHVRVSAKVVDAWLQVSVEDTGMGISAEQIDSIFEPFEQLGAKSSSGLGLVITRKLVQQHGGTIEVSSQLDSGSCFTFSLPIAGEAAERQLRKKSESEQTLPLVEDASLVPLTVATSGEHRFRILVVDDEIVNRQVLVNHLTLQHYVTGEAVDGPDTLKILKQEAYDLILLDIMMPKMSGYEVCRAIREKFSIQELPIIFLTAKNQTKDLALGFAVGGSDYLRKPISRDELLSRVRTHLQLLDINRNLESKIAARTHELDLAYKALQDMSLTDPLTGLRNRRFILKHIEADATSAARDYSDSLKDQDTAQSQGSDLTFFLVDMDHFKSVNESYGHAAGDEVLVQVRNLLEMAFRSTDYLARWAGESFLVVTRFTSREKAEMLAGRLRESLASHAFNIAGGQHIYRTCSIGYASYPFLGGHPRLLSWAQVLDLADMALYAAKRSGRNAYVGLRSTSKTTTEGFLRRVLTDPAGEINKGMLRVETSFEPGTKLAWSN